MINKLLRYYCLVSTSAAGSGHLTSSLSAVELMSVLYFGGFLKYDLKQPDFINNDRVIFSKGHASPLFYALYAVAGELTESELKTLRQLDSPLEGHPSMNFPHTQAATGSLGQGLSIGMGFALSAKYLDKLPFKTYVLLGDSEMAEGQVWEAMNLAAHYRLDNLVAIVDVNRLGQRGETLHGYDVDDYAYKARAFGWESIVIDGHDEQQIAKAYQQAGQITTRPVMIIAKTVKGKGVSFLENKNHWHGKALNQDQLRQALFELGEVDLSYVGKVNFPEKIESSYHQKEAIKPAVELDKLLIKPKQKLLATREAYGNALVKLGASHPEIIVLDAEVSNSTFANLFMQAFPDRSFEMYIAEQNLISTAVGLARMGRIPFVATFAAFWTRAFDQIRMAAYSQVNPNIVRSHVGVSIGQDGFSQMGLEDIAMMRSVYQSIVFYPSDAVVTEKIVAIMTQHQGISYLRATRLDTPIIYGVDEEFKIGGSKIVYQSDRDVATVVAAGVTLHEAMKAYRQLRKHKLNIRVIDLYSLKPVDRATLLTAAAETNAIITVEDHYQAGGIGEIVKSVLINQPTPVYSLFVKKMPRSGQPAELLSMMEIDSAAIVEKVRSLV